MDVSAHPLITSFSPHPSAPTPPPGVEYAEPLVLRRIMQAPPPAGGAGGVAPLGGLLPNDPDEPQQWWVDAIGAAQAWAAHTDATGVKVCIIDTGAKMGHEDLGNGEGLEGSACFMRPRGQRLGGRTWAVVNGGMVSGRQRLRGGRW